jgi:monolysocardiolipin acyltransferase
LEQKIACSIVGLASKYFLYNFTRLKVDNFHYLQQAIETNRPLITYTNHDATIDDPLLFGLLDSETLVSDRLRYSLGAQEICFKNAFLNRFFSAGRVIPIKRGDGIYQKGMDHALDILNKNGWIHLFPEGRVNLQPSHLIRFKWGISRLIMECHHKPLVVPFYHQGMAHIRPEKYKFGLRPGHDLQIEFGEPLDFDTIVISGTNNITSRIEITTLLQQKLEQLKSKINGKCK